MEIDGISPTYAARFHVTYVLGKLALLSTYDITKGLFTGWPNGHRITVWFGRPGGGLPERSERYRVQNAFFLERAVVVTVYEVAAPTQVPVPKNSAGPPAPSVEHVGQAQKRGTKRLWTTVGGPFFCSFSRSPADSTRSRNRLFDVLHRQQRAVVPPGGLDGAGHHTIKSLAKLWELRDCPSNSGKVVLEGLCGV